MDTLKILLVDDHAEFRRVVRDFLNRLSHLAVVGEAANGEEAILQIESLAPDLVLMDISMPGIGGFEATRIIKARWPSTRVFLITAHETMVYRVEAAAANADGFFPKSDLKRGLEDALGILRPDQKSDITTPISKK